MPIKDPSREAHFPLIEKKYGEPMSYWFDVMAEIADEKYPEQIAYLRENHGFSQAHANAVVMFSRGSKSTRRFNTPADYYKTLDPKQAKTIRAMFKAIMTKYPDLELVIAWNQPMLRIDKDYVFGASAAKNHILMATWSKDVLEKFAPKMKDLDVKKKTIGVPNDWKVDEKLLQAMVKARLAELK
ncbi:unannotated protein [freshwater metagenome]|uniref:Unannotated protein n=1 Tax=freshwater metagenome TaxID=449393 RepID=A0A6J6PGE8_9ZZZZ|nr:DUF4287 domain-containing protein [Actinomycetota bacterium]MSZ68573.1 DUF4287 domain-containing protein [Actinomycetota bacterium]